MQVKRYRDRKFYLSQNMTVKKTCPMTLSLTDAYNSIIKIRRKGGGSMASFVKNISHADLINFTGQ